MNKSQRKRLEEAVRWVASKTSIPEKDLLRFRSFVNEDDPPAGGIRIPITITASANFNDWQFPAIPTAGGLNGLVVQESIFALEAICSFADKQLWELRALGEQLVDEQIQGLLIKGRQFH